MTAQRIYMQEVAMGKQLVPDTAQFRIMQRCDPGDGAVELQNIVYVRNTIVPWTEAHLAATAADIGDAFVGEFQSQQTDDLEYMEVQAEDLGADPGNQVVHPLEGFGLDAGAMGPLSIAALIQLRGASGTDPRRGRLYLGGITEASYLGNSLISAFRTGTESDAKSFFTASLQPGDAFVLVSRYDAAFKTPANPKGLRPQGVTNVIAGLLTTVRAKVASQRDRRT